MFSLSFSAHGFQLTSPPGLALHDTQVLAWQRDNCSIIAYRATEANQAIAGIRQGKYGKKILDILTDLRFSQKELGPPHGDARVHSGFFEAVEETWPFVQALLDTGKPAIFVGHSLGAGLATYAAYKARTQQAPVEAVWTFGSPRVGNSDFAAAYNAMLGEVTYRFANELDIVTRLPVRGFHGIPFLPEYRHVGKQIALWADGHADSEWADMMTGIRINDQVISTILDSLSTENLSFAPHLVYEPALYAKNNPEFVPCFVAEPAQTGFFPNLILDLPFLLELTDPAKLERLKSKWRLV